MTAAHWSRWWFGAALLTLPWVGVGVIHLLTGVDVGAGVQPSWLCLALASAAALPRWRAAQVAEWPRWWVLWAGAVIAAVLLSATGLFIAPVAEGSGATWGRYARQVIQLGLMAAFLLWPAVWVRGDDRWRLVARWVVIGALLQAGYGVLQMVHWYRPGALLPLCEKVFTSNPAILSGSAQLHIADTFRDVPRLRGTVCEPLYLGNYLLLVLPLVGLTGWRRPWRWATTGILLLLLLLTWSRGAWLAAAAAGAVAVLLAGDRRSVGRYGLWAAGGVAVALLLAWSLGAQWVALPAERLLQSFSRRDWSNLTRLYSMQAGWRAFRLSPLVGVGWGQFSWHFPLLVDPSGLQSQFQWPVVNNYYLKILCETGLVGLTATVGFVAAAARRAWRWRACPRVRAAAVATVGVWLQLLFFSQYNLPHVWVAPGLLLAALAEAAAEQEGAA